MLILITGGAGYIGSHICVELINAGYDIIVVDNYSNSCPESLRRVMQITGKLFPIYEMDVRDKDMLSRVFKKHSIDGVIHLAGYKAVGESINVPPRYYRNNIDSTLSLLETMLQHHVSNLIFSSSATVYSKDNEISIF